MSSKKKPLTQRRLRAIEKAVNIVLASAVEDGDWDSDDDGITLETLQDALAAVQDRITP
jgi:hypothetical protein